MKLDRKTLLNEILDVPKLASLIENKKFKEAFSSIPLSNALALAESLASIGYDPFYEIPEIAFSNNPKGEIEPGDQKSLIDLFKGLTIYNDNGGDFICNLDDYLDKISTTNFDENWIAGIAGFMGFNRYRVNGYYAETGTGGNPGILLIKPGWTPRQFFDSRLGGYINTGRKNGNGTPNLVFYDEWAHKEELTKF